MRTFLMASLVAVAVLGAGCKGSSEAPPPASNPVVDELATTAYVQDAEATEAKPATEGERAGDAQAQLPTNAEDVVRSLLLTRNDFPADWVAEPQDSDDEEDFFTGECSPYNEDVFPGTLAELESDDFRGPDDQTVSSEAALFDTTASAIAAFGALNMPAACIYQAEQAFARIFKETLAEDGVNLLQPAAVTIDAMPWPALGDGAIAFRVIWALETDAGIVGGTIDSITWRHDRMLTAITYSSYVAPTLAEQLERSSVVEADEQRLAEILDYRALRALARAR